ncbi:hypothetical protein PsYK624_132090 [Phanerochaete sordida]|uniref:Uncharacterized protein n=1 Tax=Phanerochaete sordida TaxID=48140 RepID=A0A9P3LJT2_9APHY|nr:hypothetical protein PsYK624_132090 [Phanerochaete sordida]
MRTVPPHVLPPRRADCAPLKPRARQQALQVPACVRRLRPAVRGRRRARAGHRSQELRRSQASASSRASWTS